MVVKECFSLLAMALIIPSFLSYLYSVYRQNCSPHFFTWVIWSLTTTTVFFAQWVGHGGFGAWPTGLSCAVTWLITAIAYFQSNDLKMTNIDAFCLFASAVSVLTWVITDSPLWAVIIITLVDLLGFIPALREAYYDPLHENVGFFVLFIIRSCLSLLALESYSITTVLFPAAVSLMSLVFVVMVKWRQGSVSGRLEMNQVLDN